MPLIREVMNQCAVTIRPEASLSEAVRVLCDEHLSGAPVVAESGEVVGFISEPGLMDVLFDRDARRTPVSEYMSRGVYSVDPEDSIASAATLFAMYGIRRLPVIEKGRLIGVVTRRDLLQYALETSETFADPLRELIPAIGQFA